MGGNSIRKEGVTALAGSLQHVSSLVELDLSSMWGGMESEGAIHLANALLDRFRLRIEGRDPGCNCGALLQTLHGFDLVRSLVHVHLRTHRMGLNQNGHRYRSIRNGS